MKTILRTAVLLVMSLVSSVCGAEPISITELAEGDVLRVGLESSGCFHKTRNEYVLQRGKGGLKVEAFLLHYARMEGDEKSKEQRTSLAAGEVTPAQAAGLERLLAYYRHPSDTHCTTVEKISLTLIRKDGTVMKEQYVDASCISWQPNDLTFFPQLLEENKQP